MASQLQVTFGERVRARRQQLEMTQGELAEKLETSQSTISELESGVNSPTLETVERVAKALKIKPEKLIVND